VISSYGGGDATIESGPRDALRFTNVAGVRISALQIVGAGAPCSHASHGILVFAEGAHRTLAEGVAVEGVDVHGYCEGIAIGTGDDGSRISGVSIAHSAAHGNRAAGVLTFDPALGHHDVRHVQIYDVRAYENVTVGGIALFGAEDGTIARSVAYENGRGVGGSVGIWAFDANKITITENEAYRNRTTARDGDGFDLDGGVSNSVLEYNYSHENDGIGFLVCGCVNPFENRNDVVRFNISQNDGSSGRPSSRGQPSALYVFGAAPAKNIVAYHNTFFSVRGTGALVEVDPNQNGLDGVTLRDNLLAAGGEKPLLRVREPAEVHGLVVQGNAWWSSGGFRARWGRTDLRSLAALRARTGLEELHGRPTGVYADPMVCALGAGSTESPAAPAALRAYRPLAGSPLLGVALDLRANFGVRIGTHDFAGHVFAGKFDPDVGAERLQMPTAC
jgi:hypothetical protein